MSKTNMPYQQHTTAPYQSEKGQGLTEYALILILVGIAVVFIVNVLEVQIGDVFSRLANDAPVAPPSLLAFNAPPTATPHPDVTLTVNINGNGSVAQSPDQAQYSYNSDVVLTASPDSGSVFTGWSGDLLGSSNPATLTMDSDKVVTANFADAIYSVNVNVIGSGSVDLDPPGPYGLGQQVTLTANPDTGGGWAFVDWSGDFNSADNPATLTITGNMAVTATFDDSTHTLFTTTAGDGAGQVVRSPDMLNYPNGTAVTLTAIANPGSFFSGWSGDLSGGGNPATLTMNSDKNVTAIFSLAPANTFTLSLIADPAGGGTVTADPPNNSPYTNGAVVTLTAVPNPGWTFTGWSGDLGGGVTPTTVTMNSNKTITANFAQLSYTLNVTEIGNGNVTKSPDQTTYTYGQVVTLEAMPDPDWQFSNWGGDLSGSTNPTTITMDGNKSVSATFTEIPCTLPSPWQSQDIGGVATAGKACRDGGVYSIYGSGSDIWYSSDEFHYMYQTLTGDGEIIARITAQTDTDNWAKAGVMIRESLNPNSKHAFATLTPSNGIRLQYRSSTGGNSSDTSGGGGGAPIWFKLERTGNTFRAYRSNDGANWTEYASTNISMNQTVYYGIAVTSHNDGFLSTALATDIAINPINTLKLETVATSASSANWTNVSLNNSYTEMVAVCSVNYRNNNRPEVVRLQVTSASGFQIRLQNPDNLALGSEAVHCLVIEAGAWTLPDGRRIEGQTYNSTITDHDASWGGAAQSYLQSYTNPVVLGQVMSYNDTDWSVFWNQGSGRTNPPTASNLRIGKHVGQDNVTTRATETLGFIVIEAGNGTANSIAYKAALGNDSVQGIGDNPPYSYNFSGSFSNTPQIVIVTQAAMDGGNGSWAYFYGNSPVSATSLNLAVDEYDNGERRHTDEQIGYLVFGSGLVLP